MHVPSVLAWQLWILAHVARREGPESMVRQLCIDDEEDDVVIVEEPVQASSKRRKLCESVSASSASKA